MLLKILKFCNLKSANSGMTEDKKYPMLNVLNYILFVTMFQIRYIKGEILDNYILAN